MPAHRRRATTALPIARIWWRGSASWPNEHAANVDGAHHSDLTSGRRAPDGLARRRRPSAWKPSTTAAARMAPPRSRFSTRCTSPSTAVALSLSAKPRLTRMREPEQSADEIDRGETDPAETTDAPEEHAREACAVHEAREHDLPRTSPGGESLHDGRDPDIGVPAPYGCTATPTEREEDRIAEQGTEATRRDRGWKGNEAEVRDHARQDERRVVLDRRARRAPRADRSGPGAPPRPHSHTRRAAWATGLGACRGTPRQLIPLEASSKATSSPRANPTRTARSGRGATVAVSGPRSFS